MINPDFFWKQEIQYLKGVGPKKATVLQGQLNIYTFEDLLHYFPRKYVDRSNILKIRDIEENKEIVITGKIESIELIEHGKSRLVIVISDGTGRLELIWFQGFRFIQQSYNFGEEVTVFGKAVKFGSKFSISHPEIEKNADPEGDEYQKIVPLYSSSEILKRIGLNSSGIQKIIKNLMESAEDHWFENLPEPLVKELKMLPRKTSFQNIHFPTDFSTLNRAQNRLKFEELFFFQILLAQRRIYSQKTNLSHPFTKVGDLFNRFYHEYLPFELTNAQKKVIKEIRSDLSKTFQMNRLVQGDVGSGKTMVALMVMLIALDNGFQAALMAPTEILAEQHFNSFTKYLKDLPVRIELLTGSTKAGKRRQIHQGLITGEIQIIIGTHALIEDVIQFQNLGLTVIDEQHKFGVLQRSKLWKKAQFFPHNLAMTATPIPRTLAMSLYGDIDISVINELPPGRKPITTYCFREGLRLQMFGFIRKELEKGRQVYVVYPLVEESEKLDLTAATNGYEVMCKQFSNVHVGIVHGRMKPADKELEMKRFKKNETQILVSTTVIEVGVDVPNASIMVIEHADRFGLSQLHQLRGRVGRGAEQSFCILMTGNKLSDEAQKRMNAMVQFTDGFKISEVDLELRGPGDFLGTRQSGLPDFQLANIVTDQTILTIAREKAFQIVENDPQMSLPENQMLKKFIVAFQKQYKIILA